jgi:hypothetical protein
MKRFTLLFAALVFGQIAFGKIWRVNNVPGVSADFTAIQTAHDNANVQPGDTIHLEPSITNYGSLIMTKRLTIISVGNFLGANPGNQYVLVPGTMGSLTINNVSASNAVFHCNLNGGVSVTNANNLRFERCRIESSVTFNQSSNNIVLNCFLNVLILSNGNNNIISSNIIESYTDVNSTTSNTTLINNVFYSNQALTGRPMHNATLQNNIINKNGSFVFTNCVVENNIASNASLPAGSGNQNTVNMANVFVNPNGTDDVSFVLQTANPNPAAGTGKEGVDCGAFGGSNPFKRGLQPAIPAIYKLSAPVAPTGNTMNVIFSTKSNN